MDKSLVSAKNSTSAFAKQAQGLGGLVHVYATIAANVFALSAAFSVLKTNADLQIMKKAAADLSRSTGINFAKVAKKMKEVTRGALSMKDAMQAANLGISGGATSDQLLGIAEAATKAANTLGRSVPEAVTRMTQAVIKAEPELVDEFGIILRVTDATNEYARAHGKAATELNTFEKSQAIINQLLTQAEEKYADVAQYTNQFARLGASFQEMSEAIIAVLGGPLSSLAGFLADNIEVLAIAMALLVANISKKALPMLSEFSSKFITTTKETVDASNKAVAQRTENIARIRGEYASSTRTIKNYAKIVKEAVKAGNIPASAAKHVTAAIKAGVGDKDILKALKNDLSNTMGHTLKGFGERLEKEVYGERAGSTIGVMTKNTESMKDYKEMSKRTGEEIIDTFDRVNRSLSKTAVAAEVAKSAFHKLSATALIGGNAVAATWNNAKVVALEAFQTGYTQGFMNVLTTMKAAWQGIGKESAVAGKNMQRTIGVISSGVGGLVSGLSKVAGAFISISFVGTIIWQIFKGLAKFTGLWSTEAEEAADSVADINKNTKELADTTESLLHKQGRGFESFSQQAKNTEALYRNALDYQSEMNDLLKAGKNIGKGFFNNIVDFLSVIVGGDWDIEEYVESMQNSILQFSKLTGKSFDPLIDISALQDRHLVLFGGISKNAQEMIKNGKVHYNDLLKEEDLLQILQRHEDIRLDTQIQFQDAQKKSLQIMQDQALALKSAEAAMKSLNKRSTDSVTKIAQSSPYGKNLTDLQEFEKTFQNRLDQQVTLGGVDTALNKVNEQYNMPGGLNESSKILLGFTKDQYITQELIRDKIEEIIGLAAISVQQEAEKVSIQNDLIHIKDRIQKGSISAIQEEANAQIRLLEITNSILSTEFDILQIQVRAAESRGATASAALLQAQSALVIEKVLLNQQKINITYSDQNINLKKQLAVIKQLKATLDNESVIRNAKESVLFAQAKNKEETIATRELKFQEAYALRIFNLNVDIANSEKLIAKYTDIISKNKNDINTISETTGKLLKEEANIMKTKQSISEAEIAKERSIVDLQDERNKHILIELELQKRKLSAVKAIADLQSGKFGIDYAEELKNLKLVVQLTEKIGRNTIKTNETNIKLLKNKIKDLEKAENLDKSTLERAQLQSDIELLQIDNIKQQNQLMNQQLELTEKIFESKNRGTTLDAVFNNPKESMELIRKDFALAALDFSEAMRDPITRLTDSMTDAIDSSIDAFVDAVRAGENSLGALIDALGESLVTSTLDYTKDLLKEWGRNALVGLTGGKLGKTREEILGEQQLSLNTKRNQLLEQMLLEMQTPGISGASGFGAGGMLAAAGSDAEMELFDKVDFDQIGVAGIEFKDATKEGVGIQTRSVTDMTRKVFDVSSGVMGDIFNAATTSMSQVTQAVMMSLSSSAGGIGDILGKIVGSVVGGMGGGIGNPAAAGGAASYSSVGFVGPFAKGGIIGAIESSTPIKGYASGGITSGPEVAVIGEGDKREAIVPLPDNKSIPVEFTGESGDNIEITINITGVQGTEQGIRQSVSQAAMQAAQVLRKASRRNG